MPILSAVVLAALSICSQHYNGVFQYQMTGSFLSRHCLKNGTCLDLDDPAMDRSWPAGYKKCASIYKVLLKDQSEIEAQQKAAREKKMRERAARDQPILDAAVAQLDGRE